MHLKKLVPIVGFCAVSVLSSLAMADAHVREIINCATQLCMGTTANGTVLVSKCRKDKRADRAVQWWHIDVPKPGFIQNAYEEFGEPCLSMRSGIAGYDVLTTDCKPPSMTQKWTFGELGEAAEPIKNVKFGQCLTVTNGKTVEAAKCGKEDLYQTWGIVLVGKKPDCPRMEDSRMKLPQQAQPVSRMKLPITFKPICSITPPSICVRDINECGHPSQCACPLGYTYVPATGTCDKSFPGVQNSQGAPVPPIPPIEPPPCTYQPRVCTRDINECGNPSICACAKGYSYNPATLSCDLVVK
jgi:hypothetical protein